MITIEKLQELAKYIKEIPQDEFIKMIDAIVAPNAEQYADLERFILKTKEPQSDKEGQ